MSNSPLPSREPVPSVPGETVPAPSAGAAGLRLTRAPQTSGTGALLRAVSSVDDAYWAVAFATRNAGWAVGPEGRITRFGFVPR